MRLAVRDSLGELKPRPHSENPPQQNQTLGHPFLGSLFSHVVSRIRVANDIELLERVDPEVLLDAAFQG